MTKCCIVALVFTDNICLYTFENINYHNRHVILVFIHIYYTVMLPWHNFTVCIDIKIFFLRGLCHYKTCI